MFQYFRNKLQYDKKCINKFISAFSLQYVNNLVSFNLNGFKILQYRLTDIAIFLIRYFSYFCFKKPFPPFWI